MSHQHDLILALALGLIHRRIGAGEQRFQALVLSAEVGQALACSDAEAFIVALKAQALDFPLQAFGDLLGHLRRTARKHGGELLTTDTPEQITPAQRLAARPRTTRTAPTASL